MACCGSPSDGRRITRVDPVTGDRQVATTLDELAKAAGPGGVLGMALHPQLLRNAGHDEVYVAYTYDDRSRPPDARFADPASPFRHLYAKVMRLRYEPSTVDARRSGHHPRGAAGRQRSRRPPPRLRAGRHAASDHWRQGNNQLGNFCNPVQSQRLPTQAEVARRDWSAYEGKTLRITVDGGIPPTTPC